MTTEQAKIPMTLRNIIKALKKTYVKIKTIESDVIMYFKGGSSAMLKELVNRAKKNNIEIRTNSKLLSVEVDSISNRIKLYTKDVTYEAHQLTLSEGTVIEQLKIDNKVIRLHPRNKKIIHCHLLIEGENIKPFSYIHFLRDSTIHRVTDITDFAEGVLSGQKVLLFEFRTQPDSEAWKQCLQHLVDYSIINKINDIKVLNWELTEFKYQSLSRDEIEKVSSLLAGFKNIVLLKSKGDLTRSFQQTYLG